LKPENILVNDDCTIQICDFGLSRSLKDLPEEENNSHQYEEEKLASE
jgi:serine/threonine protein kinase|tara:strand:- start:1009 stop:1149 length:141 start_codon:yes stop_codon:yes gene_type:complete